MTPLAGRILEIDARADLARILSSTGRIHHARLRELERGLVVGAAVEFLAAEVGHCRVARQVRTPALPPRLGPPPRPGPPQWHELA